MGNRHGIIGKNIDDLSLNKKDITTMLDTAEAVLQAADRTGSVGAELPLCLIDKDRYRHLTVGTRCSAAKGFFVIDPFGYTRVCNHSAIRLNHYTDMDSMKTHSHWKTFVFRTYLPNECSGCGLTNQCDGGCREAAHICGKEVTAQDPLFLASAGRSHCSSETKQRLICSNTHE